MHRLAVLFVLAAGCGASPATSSTTGVIVVEATVDVQHNGAVAALPAHSLWTGRYLCAQGPTALALTLDVEPSGVATAVFDFGPLPENPTVPVGRYLLRGALSPIPGGGWHAQLIPDRWIAQPPGYVMVGLVVRIDAAARGISGTIDNPGCGGVELSRAQ